MKFEINEQLLQIKIKLNKLIKQDNDIKLKLEQLLQENTQLKLQLNLAHDEVQKLKSLPVLNEYSTSQNKINKDNIAMLKAEINNCIDEIDQIYKLIKDYE